MEELTLATPSLLFSAISLIMLAFTNRFMGYAQLVRSLKIQHQENPSLDSLNQIRNLRRRLRLTRSQQILSITSLLLCVLCTFFIYIGWQLVAVYTFGVALILLSASLVLSIREIAISTHALDIFLKDTIEVDK